MLPDILKPREPAPATPQQAGVLSNPPSSQWGKPTSINMPPAPEVNQRSFGDIDATRKLIFDNVLAAAQRIEPVGNSRHIMEVSDVHYHGPDRYSIKERKKAILAGNSLQRRLRGTIVLKNAATDEPIDKVTTTLAHVPYLTEGGTFVLNGNEYTLAHQMRLRPGIFARIKENGEIESHVNILPGKGVSHRYYLDPESGQFKINIGQARMPLMPLLRAMGVTDTQLREHWGNDIYNSNAPLDDPSVIDKLYKRLFKSSKEQTPAGRRKAVAEAFSKMELDSDVTRATLGKGFKNLSPAAILSATRKLISLNKGETDPDDRDHLAYQTFLGPEDLFAERIRRDKGVLRNILWKSSFKGDLKSVTPGTLTKHLHAAIMGSGLGLPLEEINPSDIFDQQMRVTRLGEGGIPNIDAVPDEARSVQPSHLGFIDLIRSPESFKVGIDSRMAYAAKKGSDGRIYTPLWDIKSNKVVYKSPQDISESVIAFPNQLNRGMSHVAALKAGKLSYVPRDEVEMEIPDFESSFSPLANLVPMKSAVKGQRVAMGSRMYTQALPVRNAEAPLVQTGIPGKQESFERLFGRQMGAAFADSDGVVESVTPDEIVIRNADGSKSVKELYNNLPYNRKTFLHNSPVVQPGQRVKANQVLAASNYTSKDGEVALGLNPRVAFLPYKGKNYEDAIVISEDFAKRLTSEHMYQNDIEWDPSHKKGKNTFTSIFPSKYSREVLDNMDQDGIVKPGTTVNYGDPLILVAAQKQLGHGSVMKARSNAFSDKSVIWEHHFPGVVTDVSPTKKGATVAVKAYVPTQVGDKMCYSEDTQVLTYNGWKFIYEITTNDLIATLVDGRELQYFKPVAVHKYPHKDRMYSLETTQVSLLVTDNHRLYAKPRDREEYSLIEAKNLFGSRFSLKRNVEIFDGKNVDTVKLEDIIIRCGRGGAATKTVVGPEIPIDTYLMLLGMYLSEGNLVDQPSSGSFGFDITQVKPDFKLKMITALSKAGIKFCSHSRNNKIRIYSKHWLHHLKSFGSRCYYKRIPSFIFDLDVDKQKLLLDWLMWGDGHISKTTGSMSYTTTSRRLADDIQRLVLNIGMSANIKHKTGGKTVYIRNRKCITSDIYRISIYRYKNFPTINHGHCDNQNGQREQWVDYDGYVYCPTMPHSNVIYVRRNGKPVWCGNSNRFGGKGVIAEVVPMDEMPTDKDGKPFEVLLNPLGVVSRCYDEQTEFLTKRGWVFGKDVRDEDIFVCYHPWTKGLFELEQLERFYAADYKGKMLKFENKMTNFCVTPNHRMWAACGYPGAPWQEVTAERIAGRKGWKVPVAGRPIPGVEQAFVLPHFDYHKKDTASNKEEIVINAGDWAELLGWYIAEGNSDEKVHISQSSTANAENCRKIVKLLNRLPFSWHYNPKNCQFHITSKRLVEVLKSFGLCDKKYIPDWLFRQPPHIRQRFIDSYLAGDGSKDKSYRDSQYSGASTMSERLASDLQRLFVYQGISANISKHKSGIWRVGIHQKKHRILESQNWSEIDYDGKVYCPTVPTGYIVTRRAGKILIAGNTNPAQVLEMALSKIAKKYGRPEVVHDFSEIEDLTEWVKKRMDEEGLSSTEDLIDPKTGKKIPNILTGHQFMMKLHHTSECFSADTEVLTSEGWKKWPTVTSKDKLATVELGSNKLFFEEPLELVKYHFNGDLLQVSNQCIDYAVTPNHRLLCSFEKSSDLEFNTAKNVYSRDFYIPQSGFINSENIDEGEVNINGLSFKWDDLSELIAWWAARGSATSLKGKNIVTIYQNENLKPEGFASIDQLLSRLKLNYKVINIYGRKLGFTIKGKELSKYFVKLGSKICNKKLPREFVTQTSLETRRKFLGIIAFNSVVEKEDGRKFYSFSTKSRQLADDIQEVAIRSGFSAVVKNVVMDKMLTGFKVEIFTNNKRVKVDQNSHSYLQYSGMVYCANMRNGLLYVRRNGKPMLSGNSKSQGRGLGGYTAEGIPAKGGDDASKRMAMMDTYALLSHGGIDILRDSNLIRGQRNDEYWQAFMTGHRPPAPKVPFVYEKFVNSLKASGINVVRKGSQTQLMGLTDKDIEQMAGDRYITNAETVDWKEGLKPVKGGLFDQALTGGHDGTRWARIKLHEPMPNPVFEEPIRKILNLTQSQFDDVIKGKRSIHGHTGASGIKKLLENINLDRAIETARAEIAGGKKSARDMAIRKLGYLKAAQATGVHPKDWVVSSIPVLPPAFRPVSVMKGSGGQLVADPNYLYKEVFDANETLSQLATMVDDVGEERLNVYKAFKAVTGLGDPTQPKNQERQIRGLLRHVFGDSPKFGMVQQKLLASSVNLVGRSAITPNADLDMDQVGLPEPTAWSVYKPFIIRRLVRKGLKPLDAARSVADQTKVAREALIQEMEDRPVIVDRAPVLHKYGIMAFKPLLTKGHTLQVNPVVTKGFGADFDGDQMNYHVPADDDAVEEALHKMLPSKNLFATSSFKAHYLPNQEYVGGLYAASVNKNKNRPRRFATKADLYKAIKSGNVNIDDPVEVVQT